jgi:hypothetical protein
MKTPSLNFLFVDQIGNFAHLLPITGEAISKDDFLQLIKKQYDAANPKTQLFYQATRKSIFETIRIDRLQNAVLLNQ